ncbi:MAG TPA: FdhF/YdeP family oxidoreductase [Polyangiaceae bacterium]|nr:FdhF/YdeP family oxidoreductase [Polyangiaceae bacterium]
MPVDIIPRPPLERPGAGPAEERRRTGAEREEPRTERPSTMPLEAGEPRFSGPATHAGGMAAVLSTTRYILRESGLRRGLRVLTTVNQPTGFDCPSCAWPDPKRTSSAEFCENGARAVADEATRRRVGPEFFREHSISDLLQRSDAWLNAQGRLTHPMLREAGADHYREVSWDEAFAVLADELNQLDTPDAAAFYTSGRTSNEAAFLYQLFVREFGTNNLPDCSNMCHESSGSGMSAVLGVGKGTVRLEDFEHAEAIFLVGQNPGTNHPRMLTTLREAKLRGAKLVAVNPLREAGLLRFQHPQKPQDLLGGVPLADLYLQVRVGGDIPLFKAIMMLILEAGATDDEFIERYTLGFEALRADLQTQSFDELVRACGVPEAQIRAAAEIAIASRATIVCWAMGITQHRHGVANVQELVNFLLLRGMMGRAGAGACPVRGHSNVQGDRTMGIHERPPAWTARLGERFGFAPPIATGLDVVGSIRAMRDGDVRTFFALGGNFLSAAPDTDQTARALERCAITAHVSTKLNRSHLITGRRALILPCLGRTEIDPAGAVTVEDSMSAVHASRGVLPPASDRLLSETQIVARLATATLGTRTRVEYRELAENYERIRDIIAEIVPGFADFNRRVEAPGGFSLANTARERAFAPLGGRARFTVQAVPDLELAPGQLLLSTIRSHDQFNTTVYDLNDRYRGVYGHRRVLFMHAADLEERGLRSGDKVRITSHFRGQQRHAHGFTVLPYDTPRHTAAAYFPEANVLVPVDHFAEKSHTPASKSIVITVAAEPPDASAENSPAERTTRRPSAAE